MYTHRHISLPQVTLSPATVIDVVYRAWIICNTRQVGKLIYIDRADRRVDLKSLLLRVQEALGWNLSPEASWSDCKL